MKRSIDRIRKVKLPFFALLFIPCIWCFPDSLALASTPGQPVEELGLRTETQVRTDQVAMREQMDEQETRRLVQDMKRVGTRLKKRYGLVIDFMKYDVMDLLDIEARMKVRHPNDTIDELLGDLLREDDKRENAYLFGGK